MSQCPFGGDGEFSFERFADAYNSGLADKLGNLYSRVLTMCLRYFEGRLEVPAAAAAGSWNKGLDLGTMVDGLRTSVGSFEYNVALQRIWRDVVEAANRYITETEPFKLAKTDRDACRLVLVNVADALRVAAILTKPFLPQTAATFYRAFNFDDARAWELVEYNDVTRSFSGPELRVTAPTTAGKPDPLFPKIDLG
jgi:methionyl-tRNA synthetase